MYERAISDVVIVGAGSAGLSCAWQLATTHPEVRIMIVSQAHSDDISTVEDNHHRSERCSRWWRMVGRTAHVTYGTILVLGA